MVVAGNCNTPLLPTDRSSRWKKIKLTDTIDLMELTDAYRVLHPAAISQYTFFSVAHGTFSKIHHILWHKASQNK
jgi:hypothetical protein